MRVTACVITKNEEKNLSFCLDSLQSSVSEIIVVDTGSTDNTIQMARKYNAKIYFFEWIDHFAKARNFALSKATGDWIIFLDADEYITKDSLQYFGQILREAQSQKCNLIFSLLTNYDKDRRVFQNTLPAIRIFKNDSDIKYKGAIHEYVYHRKAKAKSLNATKYIKIIHTGYSSSARLEKNKGERNLKLLLEELNKKPDDSDLCFYISEAYMMNNNLEKALDYAYLVNKYCNSKNIGIYEKNYLNIIGIKLNLKFSKSEVWDTLREALENKPDFPDFHFRAGELLMKDYHYHDAIQSFETGIQYLDNVLNSQSSAHLHLDTVFKSLGDLYYEINNLHKSVSNYVESLKQNKFQFSSLKKLLHILGKREKEDDIISFVEQVYNLKNQKETLYLIKAALSISNPLLAEYYISQFGVAGGGYLKKEKAFLKLLKRDYEVAAESFKQLYVENYNNEYAIYGIIASQQSKNPQLLENYSLITNPSLKRYIEYSLYKNNQLLSIDKKEILNIINKYLQMSKNNIDSFSEVISELNIYKEVADLLFHYENYNSAVEYYNQYLKEHDNLPENVIGEVLIKMGKSLYKEKQYDLALDFFKDAQNIVPNDYRVYEISIMVCLQNNYFDKLKEITQKASVYFPKSNFVSNHLKDVSTL
ncbi:TPR domain-containing glycosyltransferase [Tuberibacillus sp. Marseille-P3662]|uniref:TPR domain-containing glycosyltransferase n=1 Tax=Tuberibacillus sp. Marseille-P3662 TaxID=1965358 RepID=UPI001593CA23|nr:TPR domain-containing glycosyltransferase [Tuberibacillus sp. Marseille-P3662]